MPVFKSGNDIIHSQGSDVVWATNRRPALLLPDNAITINNFEVSFPDFAKSNAYAYSQNSGGTQNASCISMISINPQEWDSGLSFVANLPSGSNYFETEITLSRTYAPDNYLDKTMPDLWGSGTRHMPDGNSAVLEAIGPIVRMFALERVDNAIYLRRKQSVTDAGDVVNWNSNNNNDTAAGGSRDGWTYGGDRHAWPAYQLQIKSGGSVQKKRGQSNACSLTDVTDYSSIWRGTLVITPGYIKL